MAGSPWHGRSSVCAVLVLGRDDDTGGSPAGRHNGAHASIGTSSPDAQADSYVRFGIGLACISNERVFAERLPWSRAAAAGLVTGGTTVPCIP